VVLKVLIGIRLLPEQEPAGRVESAFRVLASADSERYQDKKIPADHSYIKQVRNPEEFSDSQRQKQRNPLAKL